MTTTAARRIARAQDLEDRARLASQLAPADADPVRLARIARFTARCADLAQELSDSTEGLSPIHGSARSATDWHLTAARAARAAATVEGLDPLDVPRSAGVLISEAAADYRLVSATHVTDALGGLGEVAVTVFGTDAREHTAFWTFHHDGHGGGRWICDGSEGYRAVRASIR